MNLQRSLSIICVCLGMSSVGVPCMAQGSSLPPSVAESSDLTADQKDAIKKLIDQQKDGLRGTASEVKRARNALLEPLRNANVTVAFRLEYTRQLTPVLRPLVGEKREVTAVNALLVAGELATAASVDMLVDALKDPRAGVRYAAAMGFESTFKAMSGSVPAIAGAQALRTIEALETALTAEKDPRVLEGVTLALQQGSLIPKRQVEGMRAAAIDALAKAVSAKTADRRLGPAADPALRRAILAIRTTVTNPAANEDELDGRVLRHAAEAAGDLLALAAERLKVTGGTADADLALMVSEAEKAIFFIQPKLAESPVAKDFNLDDLVQKGDATAYQQQVLQIIGSNGILTTAPFGFKDDRFIK